MDHTSYDAILADFRAGLVDDETYLAARAELLAALEALVKALTNDKGIAYAAHVME